MNERYSAGVIVRQTTDVTVTGTTLSGNTLGLNLERAAGTVELTGCTFSGSTTDVRIASDRLPPAAYRPPPAALVIVDPVPPPSGRLRIALPATYRGAADAQARADVVVLVDGRDVTAKVVQWVS